MVAAEDYSGLDDVGEDFSDPSSSPSKRSNPEEPLASDDSDSSGKGATAHEEPATLSQETTQRRYTRARKQRRV